MLFRLVRPVKRPDSRFAQFDKRIPADVRTLAGGGTLEVSLRAETVLIIIPPHGNRSALTAYGRPERSPGATRVGAHLPRSHLSVAPIAPSR